MFNFIQRQYFKLIVLVCYYLGDTCSRIDNEKYGKWYQTFMNISFKYDEKIDFWFWKYPTDFND
jgi:hypothetical protein